nr:hypothetical protein [Granulicella tundricola]
MIVSIWWFVVPATEPVSTTLSGEVRLAGAVYVVVFPVTFEMLPQPVSTHTGPDRLHVTLELPETRAVTGMLWPASIVEVETERLSIPPPGYPPVPQPERTNIPMLINVKEAKALSDLKIATSLLKERVDQDRSRSDFTAGIFDMTYSSKITSTLIAKLSR